MSRTVKSSKELRPMSAYELKYEQFVKDCNGQGMVFRHKKSGARVCVISNDDENKVFCIAFRTTPKDDTGVPHIIEHTVLCGSEKFPPKDPFMELAKGSLNTFLNAMTFPDKTAYPVASCNDKDFNNLMEVYMDAVLHPNLYKREEIFKQEGWHYELRDKNDPITLNGIVYSEMKGAFSTPESCQQRDLYRQLYPDTTYGKESGGRPDAIPTLTYENYLDFHRKYYHPSNSYIFLYGDVDIEERMEWLDREYLSKYDAIKVDSEVEDQKPLGIRTIEKKYSLGEDDPTENAGYLGWSFTYGRFDDYLKNEAMGALCEVLFSVPGAPLKEALIKAGIGQDNSCFTLGDFKQPCVVLQVQNVDPSKLEDMKKVLKTELTKLAEEGINKKSLLAVINNNEFNYCEADFGYLPKGLQYVLQSSGAWLFDEDAAFVYLNRRDVFDKLRELIDQGYYEQLIKDCFLGSDNQLYHVMIPEKGLAAREEQKLADQLAEYKASLSDEELDRLIAETEKLDRYRAEGSTEEELATIPMLSREDLTKKAQKLIFSETKIGDAACIYHELETNGIVYFKMMFDMDKLDVEDIYTAASMCSFMGNMDTANYSYLELNNEINIATGGIGASLAQYDIRFEKDSYRPFFYVEGKVMEKNFDRLLEMIKEMICRTKFNNPARIREILAENKSRMQYSLVAAGHQTSMVSAASKISSSSMYREMTSGIIAYRRICEILEMSDEQISELAGRCDALLDKLLGRDNLTIDIACNKSIFDSLSDRISKYVSEFGTVRGGDVNRLRRGPKFDHVPAQEAFKASGDVNYLSVSGRFENLTLEDSGAFTVAQKIISREYLYNNIRVLGGAYGAGFTFNGVVGFGSFYSYRDPQLKNTLDVYKKTADFIKEFDADERTMTKFIIGSIGDVDVPLNPSGKAGRGLSAYISGTTDEIIQKQRDAILSATAADIRRMAPYVEAIIADGNYSAVGCESTVNKNSEMFTEIKNLL